jgi:hypothetical protein
MNSISSLQETSINRLLSGTTINKLLQFEAFDPAGAYKASELLNDLKKGVWTELSTRKPIDIFRRNLQKIYTQRLIDLIRPGATAPAAGPSFAANTTALSKTNDALSIVKGQARTLLAEIRSVIPSATDKETKLHLQDLAERLNQALKPEGD